jgi:alkylhydroperoxidase/carboxymuconolactone decarboxylase family protein YurZ
MEREGKPPRPPKTYQIFTERYPDIGRAWELMRAAESKGPLDDKTMRLVKLGIALGGMREGAVHSAVRKARSAGASREEIDQVIALAASTIGLPSTVAVFSWVADELDKRSLDER